MNISLDKKKLASYDLQTGVALHPNYIVRVCGEPASLIKTTSTGATTAHLAKTFELNASVEATKQEVCDLIGDLIPNIEDKAQSRDVLKLKRNIFNLRAVSDELLAKVAPAFELGDYQQVTAFIEQINHLHHLRNSLSEVYRVESEQVSANLESVWQSKNLQHALSYTNTRLYADVTAMFANPGKKIKPKKKRQIEAGIMRYASRASLKTSPLSNFTPVYVGSWDGEVENAQWQFSGDIENRVELKVGLFLAIFDGVLKNYALIKDGFELKLNPSIKLKDGQLSFKQISAGMNVSGKIFGTGERAAQFKLNQVIQCVLAAFGRIGKASAKPKEIIDAVLAMAPKLKGEFVEQLLKQLFDMQVFTLETGYFGQNDIVAWSFSVLERLTFDDKDEAVALINSINQSLEAFLQAKNLERSQVVQGVYQKIEALAELMGAEIERDLMTPALFENSYLTGGEFKLGQGVLKPFIDDISLLTQASPFFDPQQQIQNDFADYFVERFTEHGECEDTQSFLAEFSEVYGVGKFGFQKDPNKLAAKSKVSKGYKGAVSEFESYLLDTVFCGEDEVFLEPSEVEKCLSRLPKQILNRGASHSYLGQIANQGRDEKFVINQVFSGQSGLMSRFFEVLDEDQLEEIKSYLTSISRDGSYAEVPGTFGFNANMHPQLADQELVIDPFVPNFEATEKLNFDSLTLVYDEKLHKVYFKSPDGKLLDLWYHGFLMPLLLPEMHRTLALLGMNGVLVYVLQILRSGRFDKDEDIHFIPRVCLGNTVLVRRSHMVKRHVLPSAELSELEFFSEIQHMIRERQLPSDGFIRVSPFDTNPGSEEENLDWSNLDFKNMKPFYVDFNNPRLVQVLQLALNRNNYPIVITEALPATDDQHIQVAGQGHVAEIQFEITKKPNTGLQTSFGGMEELL